MTIPEIKNERLELRLTNQQKDVIARAARIRGFKTVTDYLLHMAITDSAQALRDHQLMDLSERDRKLFMKKLNNAPAPGKSLKKAYARYLSLATKSK
jgi:uncharacterized protein (DUF1778 family)